MSINRSLIEEYTGWLIKIRLWCCGRNRLIFIFVSSCFSKTDPMVFPILSIVEPVWFELFLESRWESPAGTYGRQTGKCGNLEAVTQRLVSSSIVLWCYRFADNNSRLIFFLNEDFSDVMFNFPTNIFSVQTSRFYPTYDRTRQRCGAAIDNWGTYSR